MKKMRTCKISDLFSVEYGNSLELIYLERSDKGINFVSRTAKQNGVSAKVKKVIGLEPFDAGLITVAVGGSVLETFLQNSPFYTGFHVMVLTPLVEMSIETKLYYCYCIRSNQYKYSYGRQANSTLPDLQIPTLDSIPDFVRDFSIKDYGIGLLEKVNFPEINLNNGKSKRLVPLSQLFNIENGLASSQVIRKDFKESENWIPYIRPSYRQETSIDAYVNKLIIPKDKVFPPNTLYVSTDGQGSHTFSYVSIFEFVPNSNVSVLIPKREMSLQEKLFYAHCITSNRYKFSYGRKPKGDRLKAISLPEFPPEFVINYSIDTVVNSFNNVLNVL